MIYLPKLPFNQTKKVDAPMVNLFKTECAASAHYATMKLLINKARGYFSLIGYTA